MPDMTPVNANFSNVNGTSTYEDSSFSGSSQTNTEQPQTDYNTDGMDGPMHAGAGEFFATWALGHALDYAVGQAVDAAQDLATMAQNAWNSTVDYAQNAGAGAGAPPGVASQSPPWTP